MSANRQLPGMAQQRGSILLEGMIAILIFSIGVLAIVGMQATAVKATTDSKYRVDAAYLANQAIGRMWGNPANLGTFVEVDADVSSFGLPDGKRTVAVNGNMVTVTINWTVPGEGARSFVETAFIRSNDP